MENKQICQACGHDTFAMGQVGSITSEGNVRPSALLWLQAYLLFHLLKKILNQESKLLYK